MSTITPTVSNTSGFKLQPSQQRALRYTLYIGYFALTAGIFHGLSQALSYANIDILGYFPALKNYYQGLTAHGVANVIVFTFSFANAFLPLMVARALDEQPLPQLSWASFGALLVADVLLIYAIASGNSSVLYTSYSPLQAHWTYYLGVVLVVVSTWIAFANMLIMNSRWRRANPGKRYPLLSFVSVVSYAMWFLASLPAAVLFLGFLLPWSIGWLPKIDPLLNRTLFWFTGHAIVYAWLLPAYVSWYMLIPRQVGGKILSDSLVRFVFILFLLLSIPTGFHHQYTDPGISQSMKFIHTILTFGVFFPSLATAFSVMASLEMGGRGNGGTGLVGWIRKLPWGDASVTAQLLAMLSFVFGGITGLINSSYTMNLVIHNTTWVPGHFHMTVGSAVTLTLVGVGYWLIPYLTDRELWGRRLALFSSWIYFIGVMVFGRGMASAGLKGMPRRIFRAGAAYDNPDWDLGGILTGIGGTMMFVGLLAFFVVIVVTIVAGKKGAGPKDIPWSSTLSAPGLTGWEPRMDRIRFWFGVAIVLILVAYGPFFLSHLPPRLISPGWALF